MYREKLDLVPGTDINGLRDGNTIVHLVEIKHNKEFSLILRVYSVIHHDY